MDIKQIIQIEFNRYMKKYKKNLTLPEYKFLRQMVYGILSSQHVHLNKIGSILQESITLKKTTERLSRNLNRKDFEKKLLQAHLKGHHRHLNRIKYIIFDLSDITKTYAKSMEGLDRVHDGSKGDVGLGYWLSNLIAVSSDAKEVMPLYSELYGLKKEEAESGENKKIIESLDFIKKYVPTEAICVIDRGGDRRVLIQDNLRKGRYFVIRQVGKRNLKFKGKSMPLKQISKEIEFTESYKIKKRRKNRQIEIEYKVGGVSVQFDDFNQQLWLIKAQEEGKGYVWFLSYLPTEDLSEAIHLTMEGYGNRWKIEEVHRHIKQTYHLEEIELRKYQGLKSFLAVFFIAMGLIYQRYSEYLLQLIDQVGIKLTYRNRLSELLGFIYYKISKVISWILSKTKLRTIITYASPPKFSNLQLSLFDEWY